MKSIVLAAVLLVADYPTPSHGKIACQPHKPQGSKEWWSYRLIDGRPCWFPGHFMEKNNLYWRNYDQNPTRDSGHHTKPSSGLPSDDREPTGPGIRDRPDIDRGTDSDLRVVPVSPLSEFEDRWSGLNKCRRPVTTTGFAISDCRGVKEDE